MTSNFHHQYESPLHIWIWDKNNVHLNTSSSVFAQPPHTLRRGEQSIRWSQLALGRSSVQLGHLTCIWVANWDTTNPANECQDTISKPKEAKPAWSELNSVRPHAKSSDWGASYWGFAINSIEPLNLSRRCVTRICARYIVQPPKLETHDATPQPACCEMWALTRQLHHNKSLARENFFLALCGLLY